jgi:DNA-binding CsgD family transcriptional regulator
VKKTVLAYGLLGGVLIAVLRLIEYRFRVVEHALELYVGLVALVFVTLGVWLGRRLVRPPAVVIREVPVPGPAAPTSGTEPFEVDPARLEQLGITRREHEILQLIAAGLSNREIADRLYVSENTVKTHAGRVLSKLNARRRTQAVQLAKEAGLIP